MSCLMLNIVKTPAGPFRDIRPDLRERLLATTSELEQLRGIAEKSGENHSDS